MIEGLVSTVIPVHNRARFLREAVASVLAQTWRPIEIVIVDDGSTDDTPQAGRALESLNPSVVRLVQQANAGPGAARQRGVTEARGEFVQFLDSDDLLLERKFEVQVAALRADPAAGICYGPTWFSENGVRAQAAAQRTTEAHRTIFPALLVGRLWETSTPLYRRSAIERIGAWPATFQMEDWRFDAQAGAAGVLLARCDEFVAEYRAHGEPRLAHAWLSDAKAMRDRIEAHEEIVRCARLAGVTDDAIEMQRFARTLFFMARQASAFGMGADAQRLMRLAASMKTVQSWDLRMFGVAGTVLGWSRAARVAQWIESQRARGTAP